MEKQVLKKEKVIKPKITRLEGYLFARLTAIGSKSEGPLYYLQLWNDKEVIIEKKVKPWQNDPVLHGCLGQKVVIHGKLISPVTELGKSLKYYRVFNMDKPLLLDLNTGLRNNTLIINKMPSPASYFPPEMKSITFGLTVVWPYKDGAESQKSIWTGDCPTNQLYDFSIENPKGETIWKWSKCMLFNEKSTVVKIHGGEANGVKVPWFYFDDSITMEGIYAIRAKFIASGQEISEAFKVEIIH